jgi:flagellar motor switch protein FliN
MYCCFSPDLERAFLAAETATRFPSGPFVTGGSPVSMEMLMDVEVPVRISFGRTQIRMKELLSLNSGSLVELDRALGDRVEVLVNRCVIARGEVVAVDGNYGVRIVEIVSRQAVPPVS